MFPRSATPQDPRAEDASPEDLARYLDALIATVQVDAGEACEAKGRGSRRDVVLDCSTLKLSAAAFSALRADFERAVEDATGRSTDGPLVRIIWGLIDREDREGDPAVRPRS